MPDRTHGAVLFADISGFTKLAESLVQALGPRRAAEELTRCLNEVYEALISEVHRRGGSVVGFCGDAITCWFDGDSGLRATAVGLAMQTCMQQFASIPIPTGERIALAAKMAVAVGPARRFVVGNPNMMRMDILAGKTLQRMAAGEHLANKGEVLLHEAVDTEVRELLRVAEWRVDDETGDRYAVVEEIRTAVADSPWQPLDMNTLSEAESQTWVLPPLHERLRSGQDAFLAELRPTTALFLAFGGIDYDGDEEAPGKLDAYIRWVQEVLGRYGGFLIQITIGDKGSYIYASFGGLVAHHDDARRAVTAAVELRSTPQDLGYITHPQIGVASGRTYCGAYGSVSCCAYGVHGDTVNLAARLMQAAPAGDVIVADSTHRAAERTFKWERLTPIRVKNKAEPVQIFRAVAVKEQRSSEEHDKPHALPFVGRETQLATIEQAIHQTIRGQSRILALVGEAGMGKSRLVSEVIRRWRGLGLNVYAGECQSYAAQNSYYVWHAVLRSFFGLDNVDTLEEQVRVLTARLEEIDPALLVRLPLLGPALNLPIPDNDLTRSLDPKLRKTSLEALLVDCLRAQARWNPLLLVFEDCHWLDPLSRDLLEAVARGMTGLPILLALAYRPLSTEDVQTGLNRLPQFVAIELTSFTLEEAEKLIALKLAQLGGDERPPSEKLVERVSGITLGNPFYIEEILHYIHDLNLDPHDDRAVQRLDLPVSLDSLILSRIDQLNGSQKITIRVASVVGRRFRLIWLWGAYPELGSREQVADDLDVLSRLDLTPLDQPEPECIFLFKHIVTRDVAYESVPYGTRAILHGQLGHFIERTYDDSLGQYVDLLAYHYESSHLDAKKREYLRKAGQAAQRAYANETAIDYYRRLLPLVSDTERLDVLFDLAQVLEHVGEWREARGLYCEVLQIAEETNNGRAAASCLRAVGWLLRKQGEYSEALNWMSRARTAFEGEDDRAVVSQVMTEIGEITSRLGAFGDAKQWYENALTLAASVEDEEPRLVAQAQALKGAGTLAAQQGDYSTARTLYEESLDIKRRLGDRPGVAVLLSNLGVVAYYAGDHTAARTLDEESLAVFREIGDRWSASTLLNNLGDIVRDQGDLTAAREYLQESLDVRRQLGDMGGIAFSLNSLGDVLLDEGNYAAARPVLTESLVINRDLGDRGAMCYLLDDFAALLSAEGRWEDAIRLAGAASAARDAMGSQLAAGEKARFDRLQAPAREALAASVISELYNGTLAITLEQAVQYALEAGTNQTVAESYAPAAATV